MYRHIASALVACYLFTLFVAWLVGWAAWPTANLSPLALWWSLGIAAVGFAALGLSLWDRLESVASLAISLCPLLGLMGAVMGMMVLADSQGSDATKWHGAATVWSTTLSGMTMSGLLLVHRWLLGMGQCK